MTTPATEVAHALMEVVNLLDRNPDAEFIGIPAVHLQVGTIKEFEALTQAGMPVGLTRDETCTESYVARTPWTEDLRVFVALDGPTDYTAALGRARDEVKDLERKVEAAK